MRTGIIQAALLLLSDACLLFLSSGTVAQPNRLPGTSTVYRAFADTSAHTYTAARHYYLLYGAPVPTEAKLVRKINDSAAIVWIGSQEQYHTLSRRNNLAAVHASWKLSPAFSSTGRKTGADDKNRYVITGSSPDTLLAICRGRSGAVEVLSVNRPSASLLIRCRASYLLNELLSLDAIVFADIYAPPHTEIGVIGYNRGYHGISSLGYQLPDANGKGIVAGIKEQRMDEEDLDLYKRVLPSGAGPRSRHATEMASVIGGAGNSFYDGKGIAPQCSFFSSSFDNLFADDEALLSASRVSVQNHSYGTVIQPFYGAEAASYDIQVWHQPYMVPVFSAGNRGLSAATEGSYAGITGYGNLTGNFKMAKNIITVGAIDLSGNTAPESSAGPAYDGRLAPQLVAYGPSGSSDAAAAVTGTVAVMQQVYADSNNHALPPASLIRSALYNTADDILTPGIDYKSGYGSLNSYAAVELIRQKQYDTGSVMKGDSWQIPLTIPAGIAQLRVTLAWTDTAAAVNSRPAIVNDLDLELIHTESGTVFPPWVLNPEGGAASLGQLPVRARDALNTAEQASIILPAAGNYLVRVSAAGLSSSRVRFSIAYKADTLDSFSFTHPRESSDIDINEQEQLTIRWSGITADSTASGNLYISYDEGVHWQWLHRPKIKEGRYNWIIKDTSAIVQFRMETAYGDFISGKCFLSRTIRLRAGFLCSDSLQLTWNRIPGATAYTVFALTDSAYLAPVFTVSDTFRVIDRAVYPYLVYAVQPRLSNNVRATRSRAVNINLEGIKCFYKTLYYEMQEGNRPDLILEMAAPAYTDSIYFEQISAQGQLKQVYGGLPATDATLYRQTVHTPEAGTTYWRARILLKNGASVYTEIISLLSSGPKAVFFYPNPSGRQAPLNMVLSQGIQARSIRFFDNTGRLLLELPAVTGSINLSRFPPGMILYRVVASRGEVMETGKIILQP